MSDEPTDRPADAGGDADASTGRADGGDAGDASAGAGNAGAGNAGADAGTAGAGDATGASDTVADTGGSDTVADDGSRAGADSIPDGAVVRAVRRLVTGRVAWPRVLFAGLALAVVAAVVVLAATSTAAFGVYNPGWDGASDFRDRIEADPGVEREIVRETGRYDEFDPEGTVAFVVAPESTYEGADAERLRAFVADGGTLVVLENFGDPGNALLADVGADARLDGRLLRDEQSYHRGPAMPIATDVRGHELTAGVDRLTLNYATAVEPGEATVLAGTSDYAYLGPESVDLAEADVDLDSYPVATAEPVGDGRVVVAGDPSLTINAMYTEPDNAAFLEGLYADADRVVIDVSHAAPLPPLASATLFLRETPAAQLAGGLLAVAAVGVGASRRVRPALSRRVRPALSQRVRSALPRLVRDRLPGGRRPGASGAGRGVGGSGDGHASGSAGGRVGGSGDGRVGPALSAAEGAAFLRRRHPEWDEARVRRVMAAFNRTRSKGDRE